MTICIIKKKFKKRKAVNTIQCRERRSTWRTRVYKSRKKIIRSKIHICSGMIMKEEIEMGETLKVLETRRSCRAYKPELIEEEKLQAIIKAGTYAATGMGKQSPIIIAVTNKEL